MTAPSRPGSRLATAALVVLALPVVAGCAAGTSSGSPPPASRPSASAPAGPTTSGDRFAVDADPGAAAPSEVRDRRPTAVVLPSGVRVPVRAASTGQRGLLRVPRDVRVAGWWDGGAQVGAAYGAMVVAGHVDSTTQGLGPFAELLGVEPGDSVDVAAGRLRQRFAVTGVDRVAKATLHTRGELFAATGPVRLVLITCAGDYDPARGGYQELAVVTARPTGDPQSR